MSLFGALSSGVSGLRAQSSALGAIADNVTNVNTVGYKSTDVQFKTLVTASTSTSQYSPGGVQSAPQTQVDLQGLLQASTSRTDVGIDGEGLFIVSSLPTGGEDSVYAYTRAGSFTIDEDGFLKNTAGWYLQGWPLQSAGKEGPSFATTQVGDDVYIRAYPDENGDLVPINDSVVTDRDLRPLNLNTIGGTATETKNVSIGANLPANAEIGTTERSSTNLFDSLGNPATMELIWEKVGENRWGVSLATPAGAATAELHGTEDNVDPEPDVFAASGLLEFTHVPTDGETITITDGSGVPITFEFDTDNTVRETSTRRKVDISAVTVVNPTDVAPLFKQAIDNSNLQGVRRFQSVGSDIKITQSIMGAPIGFDVSKIQSVRQNSANSNIEGDGGLFTVSEIDFAYKNGARIDFEPPHVQPGETLDLRFSEGNKITASGGSDGNGGSPFLGWQAGDMITIDAGMSPSDPDSPGNNGTYEIVSVNDDGTVITVSSSSFPDVTMETSDSSLIIYNNSAPVEVYNNLELQITPEDTGREITFRMHQPAQATAADPFTIKTSVNSLINGRSTPLTLASGVTVEDDDTISALEGTFSGYTAGEFVTLSSVIDGAGSGRFEITGVSADGSTLNFANGTLAATIEAADNADAAATAAATAADEAARLAVPPANAVASVAGHRQAAANAAFAATNAVLPGADADAVTAAVINAANGTIGNAAQTAANAISAAAGLGGADAVAASTAAALVAAIGTDDIFNGVNPAAPAPAGETPGQAAVRAVVVDATAAIAGGAQNGVATAVTAAQAALDALVALPGVDTDIPAVAAAVADLQAVITAASNLNTAGDNGVISSARSALAAVGSTRATVITAVTTARDNVTDAALAANQAAADAATAAMDAATALVNAMAAEATVGLLNSDNYSLTLDTHTIRADTAPFTLVDGGTEADRIEAGPGTFSGYEFGDQFTISTGGASDGTYTVTDVSGDGASISFASGSLDDADLGPKNAPTATLTLVRDRIVNTDAFAGFSNGDVVTITNAENGANDNTLSVAGTNENNDYIEFVSGAVATLEDNNADDEDITIRIDTDETRTIDYVDISAATSIAEIVSLLAREINTNPGVTTPMRFSADGTSLVFEQSPVGGDVDIVMDSATGDNSTDLINAVWQDSTTREANQASDGETMAMVSTNFGAKRPALVFNGDGGTLAQINVDSIDYQFANGAGDQEFITPADDNRISLFLGHLNRHSDTQGGLTQRGGPFNPEFIKQNGARFGTFSNVTIGEDGVVTARFSNGTLRPVFQIPVATFPSPNGLESMSGNVFTATDASGGPTVRVPGEGGAGDLQGSTLESSTVDLGEEFTSMIVTQRAYSAAAKVITTADEMLDELLRIR